MTRGTTFSASSTRRHSCIVEIPRRSDAGLHAIGEYVSYAELRARVAERTATLGVIPDNVPVVLRPGKTIPAVVDILAIIGQPAVLLPASWTDAMVAELERETVTMQRLDSEETAVTRAHAELVDIALCQPTSGSTSKPRLAGRSERALRSEIDTLQAALELAPYDRVLCCSSIGHSYGLMAMLTSIESGAEVWLGDDLDTIRRARPTVIFGLGPYYERLLAHDLDLTAVRLAFSAGAPLPDGLYDRFLDRFHVPIRQDYGTTETGTISLDLSPAGTPIDVGTPLTHIDVRLSGGHVAIRGDAVAAGYVAPSGMQSCRDGAGWYETADSGSLVGGRIRLGPRLREPIVVGDTTIRVDDLERRIAEIPEVRDVAVIPAPGGRLKIVVVGKGVRRPVADWCRDNLPPSVYRATSVETRKALPRSPAGKLLRNELMS